jgi:hypothetical protein
MTKMKRHLLAILLAMLLISCEDVWHGMCGGDYLLDFHNKSTDTVYVFTMMGGDTIPSVTITEHTECWIAENTDSGVFAVDTPWDKLSNPIRMYIIDKDTMQKYDLSVILATYNILCRYDLSGNDIKQLDYTIPYPPPPMMKDMKMYPPYEEVIKQEKGL